MVKAKQDENKIDFEGNILNSMIDWVRVVNKDKEVLYINDAIKRDLGNSSEKSCYEHLGKIEPCNGCVAEEAFNKGEILTKEEELMGKIYSIKCSPMTDSTGELYGVVEVFRDITREKTLEQEVKRKNKKINEDLELARKIQKKLLPKKNMHERISIDYVYRPSEMLSGDMFDIFKIGNNKLGVYINDVVGHGVAASIVTLCVRQITNCIADGLTSPSEVLKKIHAKFLELDLGGETYFTILYGEINLETNEFIYVNGGHNSIPLLIRDEKIIKLENVGFPINSLIKNVEYKEKRIKLEINDKILMYTDGLIEAKNKENKFYGFDRFLGIIKENINGDIIETIKKDVEKFKYHELEDDFTVLKLEIK